MGEAVSEPVELLSRSVHQTGEVLRQVAESQWTLPSPCHHWSVSALVDHVLQSLRNGAIVASGGRPDWLADAPQAGPDRHGEFGVAADALLAAWRSAGDLRGTTEVPGMGSMPRRMPVDQLIAEFAVHAWDMARATGQSTNLDREVGESSLAWARGVLTPQMRGEAFGPEVAADASTPLYDRLAAFFGRDPAWPG